MIDLDRLLYRACVDGSSLRVGQGGSLGSNQQDYSNLLEGYGTIQRSSALRSALV